MFFVFSFLLVNTLFAAPGVPSLLHHQGRLLDSTGNLLGGSSGTNYCFKFSLYDATAAGTKIWPSGSPSKMTVEVKNGILNVDIGDVSAGGDLLDFDFASTDEVYLNIDVADSIAGSCAAVSSFETLSPRQRVVSSGYALNSKTVGGFTPSQTPTGNQVPVLSGGALNLAGAVNAGGLTLGVASTTTGAINLKNSTNSNAVIIQSGVTATPYTLTLPTDDGTPNQFLQTDGSGALSWATIGGGGDALVANPLSQFSSTTSAQLAGVISDETGTGALVFADSPIFTTPNIGSATGSVSGNAGTATALAANPTDCAANQFATTIAANGNLTCASISDADVPNTITIDLATLASTVTNATFTTALTVNTGTVTLIGNAANTSALTLGAGASSISGSHSGTSSGTNTGDQTITLTGDVTGSGTGSFAATIAADSVALTTDTTGNYVTAVTTSVLTGLTGGNAAGEGTSSALAFDYSQALSGDPALAANAGVFGTNGMIFEGSAANTFEAYLAITNPTADNTYTFPDRSGTTSLSGDTFTGDVTGTLSSTGATGLTVADNSVDGTDIALGSDAQGDVMYYDGTNWVRLAAGTSGQFLKTQGAGANPVWDAAGLTTGTTTIASGTNTRVLFNDSGVLGEDAGFTFTKATDALLIGGATSIGSTLSGTAKGLVVDNNTSSGNIFEAQDNGSAVFTVADGGNSAFSGTVAIGGTTPSNDIYLNLDKTGTFPTGAVGSLIAMNRTDTGGGTNTAYRGDMRLAAATSATTMSGLVLQVGPSISGATLTNGYGVQSNIANVTGATLTTGTAGYFGMVNQGTATTWKGIDVIIANSGTIGTTYGMYVGDITSGTQTNTPFSFYAVDANALNYFAGSVGIGDASPASLFTVGASDAFQINSSGQLIAGSITSGFGAIDLGADNFTTTGVVNTDTLTLTNTGTINGLDAIDATTETTLEAALDIGGDVTGTGLSSVVIADNAVDGTDIALGSDAQGDVMYYDGTNWVRLAAGTSGQFLKTQGAGANPVWDAAGGSSAWDTLTSPTGNQALTFNDGELNTWTVESNTETFQTITANSLTTGKILSIASSSLTTGSLIDLAVTGTAGATGQKGLNISLSGANATGAQTTYGGYISNTHTGTSNNVGLYVTASGGSNNYAGIFESGRLLIGTASETASSSKVYITNSFTNETGSTTAVAGLHEDFTFTPTTGNTPTQVGNRLVITNNGTGTAVSTDVGQIVRMVDNTDDANTIRGLEIVASAGSNTAGINTGVRTTGGTFGLEAITTANSGGSSVPAAIFGQNTGTTAGDVLRLYSTTMTSAPSFATFYQNSSTFTGTGLLMDFAESSGGFSGNFIDLQKNNTTLFKVDDTGDTTVYLSASTNNYALCHETNGAGVDQIKDCAGAPSADYAEMYPVAEGVEFGDIVVTGNEMVDTYDITDGGIDWTKVKGTITQLVKSNQSYQGNIIGIVVDNYGDFTSAGHNIKDEDHPMPIALNGRVPVKISNSSATISAGDYITTSAESGKGMKATSAGQVIGKALEPWTPNSGKDTVMVFVEPGYYNGPAPLLAGLSFDENGNATFNGEVTATKLNVNEINLNDVAGMDAIADQVSLLVNGQQAMTLTADSVKALSNSLNTVSDGVLVLQEKNVEFESRIANLENAMAGAIFKDAAGLVTLDKLMVSGTANFGGEVTFDGLAFFNSDVSFAQKVVFNNATQFTVPPLFNSDTAGFAVIHEGANKVEVVFDTEYAATPVVNTTISFEADDNVDETVAQEIFTAGVQNLVINKSTTGFTIILNKNAPRDIRFSWTALAVKDAKVFEGLMPGLVISGGDESPVPPPTPEGEGGGSGDVTPPPEPEVIPGDTAPEEEVVVPAEEPTPDPVIDPTSDVVPEPIAEPEL